MIDTTIDYYYDGDEEGACNRQSVQKDEAKQVGVLNSTRQLDNRSQLSEFGGNKYKETW